MFLARALVVRLQAMDVIEKRRRAKRHTRKKKAASSGKREARRQRSPREIVDFVHSALCMCVKCLRQSSPEGLEMRALTLEINRNGYIVYVVDRNANYTPASAKRFPTALPLYAYTLGCARHRDQAELIVFGADAERLRAILKAAIDAIDEQPELLHGLRFETTISLSASESIKIGVAQFRRKNLSLLPRAVSFYDLDYFAVRQIVVADSAGRLPWDANYESAYERSLIDFYDDEILDAIEDISPLTSTDSDSSGD